MEQTEKTERKGADGVDGVEGADGVDGAKGGDQPDGEDGVDDRRLPKRSTKRSMVKDKHTVANLVRITVCLSYTSREQLRVGFF